ncbi:hypothetical protein CKAH01_12321 [Colletotrichum kahawae]|uniref:Uncharacterized protein n=1 Tax=Colletotrichum kahawae TaxID=34407 RepID=A0AAE0DCU4_COLKA|nr:hypothetical protein CKAH01_12321 [Colletotrichum kahawae]
MPSYLTRTSRRFPRPRRFQVAASILSIFQVSSPSSSIIGGGCSLSNACLGKGSLPARFRVSTWKRGYIAVGTLSSTTYSEITFVTAYLWCNQSSFLQGLGDL